MVCIIAIHLQCTITLVHYDRKKQDYLKTIIKTKENKSKED